MKENKLESYKLPTCCNVNDIENSEHYPGWTSGDNISGSYSEEDNNCVFLGDSEFNDEKHPCWGQVVWYGEELSIDFVQNLHVCEGHKLITESYPEDIKNYLSYDK